MAPPPLLGDVGTERAGLEFPVRGDSADLPALGRLAEARAVDFDRVGAALPGAAVALAGAAAAALARTGSAAAGRALGLGLAVGTTTATGASGVAGAGAGALADGGAGVGLVVSIRP